MNENKIKWIKYESHSNNSYGNDDIKMANWNIVTSHNHDNSYCSTTVGKIKSKNKTKQKENR